MHTLSVTLSDAVVEQLRREAAAQRCASRTVIQAALTRYLALPRPSRRRPPVDWWVDEALALEEGP